MLTFVIAGGGFAGVELAGALNDFARGILADYPNLRREDVRVVLVHARDRILPELSESLGRYAQSRMEARGVEFRLNTRLTDAQPGAVVLSDGEIPAETLVWTAGTAPNPLTKSLPLEKDKRGAVIVDATLAVPGHAGVWALGDCAAVVDAKTGKPVRRPHSSRCVKRRRWRRTSAPTCKAVQRAGFTSTRSALSVWSDTRRRAPNLLCLSRAASRCASPGCSRG